jgi:hypothetical protein
MTYYLLLPFVSIGIVSLQTILADILFSGWLALELSLIVVIYAGFHLDLLQGITLAFVTGFVFDCVAGTFLGLFTLIYLIIFLLSFFVSLRIDSGKLYLIALFSFICSLFESCMLILLYHCVYKFDMLSNVLAIFVPQALLISVLSVGFFNVMRKVEGLMYGKTIQSQQRSGTNRVSAKA